MGVSTAMRRLLRVLDMEEALRRRELESAQGELTQLELALRASSERQRNGRRLIASAVHSDDLRDRLAGKEEVQAGERSGAIFEQRIHRSSLLVEDLRTALLDKRVERKQAEALIKAAEAGEAIEAERRMQQSLDDWYLTRIPAERSESEHAERVPKRRTD
jgi:hypothetical protein